ncbi:bifunctional hydroxymethylpyrimidine kinase/phosphomethylpyrimidine kinase [Acidipila sp. 4G-K13]|nr:bifunctional hydroxymethylpyrimidine kinase/phosphomethylpyrimidine kinase [Paracidobacterium acidisoli]
MSGGAPPVALTVAGFDPGSGAGITADLKVFAAHGLFGVSAITALTVQSTQGVRRVEPVAGALLRETLDCLAADVEIAGVKIGMLGSTEVTEALAGFLAASGIPRSRVVLDPVLRSSSGKALLEEAGVRLLREKLLPQVGWVTPNLAELAVLTGLPEPAQPAEIPEAARALARMAAETGRAAAGEAGLHVVVTGGHLDRPDDFLLAANGEERWFPGTRVETSATHGTGCAFSSALLSRVLLGDGPVEAVAGAKAYVRAAMKAAYPIGKGRGPMHHLYALEPKAGEGR